MKGYVRKRGNTWSYTVDIGKDPISGKRKQKTQSGFKTKKEAQAALAELNNSVDKGLYIEPHKKIFKEFAMEYVNSIYKNKVKASTFERTVSLLNNQILPWFKEIKLDDIDPFVVNRFYAEKKEEGLSSAYVRRMHEILKMLLKTAYRYDFLMKDIGARIDPPQLIQKKMDVWSVQQVNDFLKHTKHSRYHPVFFLAAYTGMRKGEIIALHWDDIDFEEKTISINKTLYKIKDRFLLQEPKTLNSVRTIYIDDDIVSVLKRQRVKQNIEKLRAGGCVQDGGLYQDSNLVFAQENGSFIHPTSVNALFLQYIRQTDIPRIRFHDLRHTHATILLQMGVNPKVVSERLGHSSVKITLDVYSHVLPSMKKDLSEQFSKMMKSGKNVVNEV